MRDTPTLTSPCDTCADVDWLLRWGTPGEVIAARLHRNREALQRHLRSHDRALLERFNTATYTDRRTA